TGDVDAVRLRVPPDRVDLSVPRGGEPDLEGTALPGQNRRLRPAASTVVRVADERLDVDVVHLLRVWVGPDTRGVEAEACPADVEPPPVRAAGVLVDGDRRPVIDEGRRAARRHCERQRVPGPPSGTPGREVDRAAAGASVHAANSEKGVVLPAVGRDRDTGIAR